MKGSGAESFSVKSMKSIEAGCDMVLICNDFDGASEAVNFFTKENISFSKKIGNMKKIKSPIWNDLINNEKRLKTIEVIKKIGV
jgi:beta-glucosidase-like glycosyl hydrolase